jgi:hypothetical protein
MKPTIGRRLRREAVAVPIALSVSKRNCSSLNLLSTLLSVFLAGIPDSVALTPHGLDWSAGTGARSACADDSLIL